MKKFLSILGLTLIAIVVLGLIFFPASRIMPLYFYSLYFPMTKFELSDNSLIMDGLITRKTPGQIYKIFDENPNIDTIEMREVLGSLDDNANLEIALWVAGKAITTKIGRYSEIASGGTDFFLAGSERIVLDGAKIGVHSWGSFDATAADFPRGHELHQPYIEYYQNIGLTAQESEDFYYFTIDASTFDDVHFMTDDEIIRYKLSTTGIGQVDFIVTELEEQRQKDGFPHITPEEARDDGIEVISNKEYKQRLKARNAIELQ